MMDYSLVGRILTQYRCNGYYPSAVCRVFNSSGTLYTASVGDVKSETWFDLASVSKIICTTMALFLMDDGRMSPDTPVLSVLPSDRPGAVTRRRLENVTLRQIMTHTSGIVPWFPFYSDGRDFYTVLERVLSETPEETGMAYSDLNFMLLGEIVCHLTGRTLRENLSHFFHQHLGIQNIAYGPVDPALCAPSCYGNQIEQEMCRVRNLTFSGWRENGVPVRGSVNDGNAHYFFNGASGHAGVFSDAQALEKLCRFYMNTDKPAFLEAMETNIEGRGLGFDRSITFPEGCGHSGFTGTSIWFSREHNIGAVILTNKYYRSDGISPGNTNELRRAVHYALLGKQPPEIP